MQCSCLRSTAGVVLLSLYRKQHLLCCLLTVLMFMMHCREGQYSVLEHDPVMGSLQHDEEPQSPTSTMDLDSSFWWGEQLNNAGSYNLNSELDEIRAQLERLLPE